MTNRYERASRERSLPNFLNNLHNCEQRIDVAIALNQAQLCLRNLTKKE